MPPSPQPRRCTVDRANQATSQSASQLAFPSILLLILVLFLPLCLPYVRCFLCLSMFLQASSISCCLQKRNQLNISSRALRASALLGLRVRPSHSMALTLTVSFAPSLAFRLLLLVALGTCLTRNYFGPVALFSVLVCVCVHVSWSHCVP